MTLRSSLALAAVVAVTPLSASGPQDDKLDEINFDNILTGDFPERLQSDDVLTFVVYLKLAGQFEERHRSLFQPKQPSADGDRSDIYQIWHKSEVLWHDILKAAGQATSIFDLRTYKYVKRELVRKHADGDIRTYTVSQFVHNCLEDAFRTAHRTLADRRARYGAGSVELSRWLDAQVKVFAQCDGEAPFEPPEEPGPDWQPLAQHDRRYQIAAAYFYNGQYLEAASRFDEIAGTPDSPWRDLGRYLVPRSLAREAIVTDNDRDRSLALALEAYRELANDPDFVDDFPSIIGQIRHVETQRDPVRFRRTLERRIQNEPHNVTAQGLEDFIYLHLRRGAWSVDEDATGYERWRLVLREGSAATAVEHWRTERSLPWLYLALAKARADSAPSALTELIDAAGSLPADTPGYVNMLLARIRIHGLLGEADAAQRIAEAAFGGNLNKSEVHRVRIAVAETTLTWTDYLRWASLKPLSLSWTDDFARRLPSNYNRITTETPLFSPKAAMALNNYFTPSMVLDAIDTPGLGDYQRGRMAIAGWTKAMLDDDLEAAMKLSVHIRRHVPLLAPELERFEMADDKHFEAARIIFDYPAFSPWLLAGAGRTQSHREERDSGGMWIYRSFHRPLPDYVASPHNWDNWWCADRYGHDERRRQAAMALEGARFSLFSEPELEAIKRAMDARTTAATTSFGPHVIRYAKDNLDDPRVPRTLHRLVFATRYACYTAPGDISRAAYALLHKNFPDSEWAEKTPYWFAGHQNR